MFFLIDLAVAPPEALVAEASAEVERLLGAIAALGDSNPHSTPLEGSPSCCSCQVQGPPSERENRGVQELHREGKEAPGADGSRDCQSPGTESNFRVELRDGGARMAQLHSLSEAQREEPAGPSVVELQRRIETQPGRKFLGCGPTEAAFAKCGMLWSLGTPPLWPEWELLWRKDLQKWPLLRRMCPCMVRANLRSDSRRQEEVHRSHPAGWESGEEFPARSQRHPSG